MTGYYVSVRDGGRWGLLLGPYDEHEEALANVDRVRRWVQERDTWAWFYGFGTAKVTNDKLPAGRLNDRLPLREDVTV